VRTVFVYGTLLPGERGWRWYLRHVADRHLPAALPGHALYGRTRPYPFAVPAAGFRVVGAVAWLTGSVAGEVVARLDEYEGTAADPPLYVRRAVEVVTAEGPVGAWVWLAGPAFEPDPGELIPSGDWRAR
jgi:gamma-glutamylcyclotransferase (GGCT)/AIG2-like uncharacterized protein YtfP